ncbi:hypothetical protein DFR29_104118 [Tahibacter aquaticus]|uniref:Type II CBASS E2 protein domain-containing protein n=1 Tax=Tahibacter aquaticus TaxID=520092 RepID=A0A4R6Z290_9GAMM|nr:hypothetical protein [Tahibacter aquaticus]TDR45690.1 hypothetical protein DFR29_104118 [Tahibacter aquaticus]
MTMSMENQIRRMLQLYPGFEIRLNGGWHVVWEGSLKPFAKTYRVQIALTLKDWIDDMPVRSLYPQVWLMNPTLEIVSEQAPDVLVPHIYLNTSDARRSTLCLFDPAQREWTRSMAIAETTIPWTIDWLASYEGWLATGEWTGGGRDHTRPAA